MFAPIVQPPLFQHHHRPAHHPYMPSHPSPLSPRHVNVPSAFSSPTSMSPAKSPAPSATLTSPTTTTTSPSPLIQTTTQPGSTPPSSTYAQRFAASRISNPLRALGAASSPSEAAREKRRAVFLNKIRRDREDGKYSARGEQLLRLDYLRQQKQFEKNMARQAPDWGYVVDHDMDMDMDVDVEGSQTGSQSRNGDVSAQTWTETSYRDEEAALEEYLLSQEGPDPSLQALIDELENPGAAVVHAGTDSAVYSEDEDYDSLFMDIAMDNDNPVAQPQLQPFSQAQLQSQAFSSQGADMDVSHG